MGPEHRKTKCGSEAHLMQTNAIVNLRSGRVGMPLCVQHFVTEPWWQSMVEELGPLL
jgi:hypothetical protein